MSVRKILKPKEVEMDAQGLAKVAQEVYNATSGLMKMVPPDKLDWRPSGENNWMTLGQLLAHLPEATGLCIKGFVTGEWPDMPEGEMLPSAEKMPSVSSVNEAVERLEADRKVAMDLLAGLSDEDFRGRTVTAPWNPEPTPLWMQLLFMVEHQIAHKNMLFAYLKLLGLPVNTGHLYGMPSEPPE
jgi:uncharacterized damage-inducible protein DinB